MISSLNSLRRQRDTRNTPSIPSKKIMSEKCVTEREREKEEKDVMLVTTYDLLFISLSPLIFLHLILFFLFQDFFKYS